MGIKNILGKLLSPTKSGAGKGLTSYEVELSSYLEEQRRDKIKELVGKFREQRNKEMFEGASILKEKNILNAPSIMNQPNTLLQESLPTKNSILAQDHKNLFFK